MGPRNEYSYRSYRGNDLLKRLYTAEIIVQRRFAIYTIPDHTRMAFPAWDMSWHCDRSCLYSNQYTATHDIRAGCFPVLPAKGRTYERNHGLAGAFFVCAELVKIAPPDIRRKAGLL